MIYIFFSLLFVCERLWVLFLNSIYLTYLSELFKNQTHYYVVKDWGLCFVCDLWFFKTRIVFLWEIVNYFNPLSVQLLSFSRLCVYVSDSNSKQRNLTNSSSRNFLVHLHTDTHTHISHTYVYLSICLPIYLYVNTHTHTHHIHISISVYLSMCLPIYLT